MTRHGILHLSMAATLVVSTAVSASAQQHMEGQIGPGSRYALDLPEVWNGDLIVYAHGIVDPALPVALPSSQDNFTVLRDALLARGFAIASSSFSENGFALKDASQRTHQLSGLFTARFGQPRRVLLAGHSLGAMATLQLAETFPEQYSGALVMCGFVGGTQREVQYMATARLAYDYYFPGVIPGSVFSIPDNVDYRPGTALFSAVQSSLVGGFAPPFKTFQFAAAAGLPGNSPAEIVAAALNVLGFNLRYTRDLLAHTHGHIPFDNRDVVYGDPGLNQGIGRWTADPAALNYIEHYYEPTGAIRVPLQTLHSDRDPVVPAWHETIYRQRAVDQGTTGLLDQTTIPTFGHCAFTVADVLTAFDRLLARVQ